MVDRGRLKTANSTPLGSFFQTKRPSEKGAFGLAPIATVGGTDMLPCFAGTLTRSISDSLGCAGAISITRAKALLSHAPANLAAFDGVTAFISVKYF
jgi:hypothetical protein